MILDHHLDLLESTGLIRRTQSPPGAEYLFRHALIQDAAYGSLVKQERRRLHRIIGEALERLYPYRLDELAPLLGQHFDEAGDAARALRYFTRAGDAASRVYALPEAIGHYTRALELAARTSGGDGSLADLFVKLGQAYHSNARWDEAWANYLEMENVARARGDRALELASLIERALLRAVYGPLLDPAQAETLCQRALTLAHELGDRAAEARSLWVRMRANTQAHGDPNQAVADGERSLALARELGLSEQLAYTLNDIQYAYRNAGQIEQGLAALAEARDLWRANGNQHMLADNLNQTAFFHLYQSDFDAALAFTSEALTISQPTRNVIQQGLTSFIIGQIYLERGEFARSLEVLEEGARAQVASGMGIFAIIGSVYAAAGLVDHAIELTQTTLDNIEATGLMSVFGPSVLGALARLRLLKHNVPAAEAQIRRARQIVKPGFTLENFLGGEQVWLAEAELILARQDYALAVETLDALLAGLHAWGISRSGLEALYLKGKACLALGRLDDARAAFESARTQAEAAPARILLWQILAALSQIEAQRGRRVEAQSLRVQTRQVITFIADHAPPELRASFLELPDVRAVMNET